MQMYENWLKCYFGGLKKKRIVRQKDYKMNNFWKKKSSYQQTKSLSSMLRKLAPANDLNSVMYSLDSTQLNFISTKMVRIRARENLRMQKQNTKTKVPLDVVPERCTERFRPVGSFCEPRFRSLSSPTGREGEICRPPDHMRLIRFILSTDQP